MARLQSSPIRMCLEWRRLGDRWSMYLRHAPLDLPFNRQYPKQNARFLRSYFGSDDLFLRLLVDLYPTSDTLDPAMAHLDQDQACRVLPILYRYVGVGFDRFGRCWRYLDQEGVCYWK